MPLCNNVYTYENLLKSHKKNTMSALERKKKDTKYKPTVHRKDNIHDYKHV